MSKQSLFNIAILIISLISLGMSTLMVISVSEKTDKKEFTEWSKWSEDNIKTLFANDNLILSNEKVAFDEINKMNGSEEIKLASFSAN